MSNPLLKKARDLLMLAVGEPNEQAARTAAVGAARLIHEHGFQLVEASEAEAAKAKTVTHIPYSETWQRVFAAVDPQGRPEAFCSAVQWTTHDLVKMLRDNEAVSKDKLRRLLDFCATHRVPLPFGPEHPAYARIVGQTTDKETALEKAVGAVTVRDIFKIFGGR